MGKSVVEAVVNNLALFAGIVTRLGGNERGGQAVGLIVFALFAGFGSILFGEALRLGFDKALFIFAGIQFIIILAAIPLFRNEIPNKQESKMTKSSYNKEQNMETIRFRTNIGCSSCIKAASFFLDGKA